MALTSSFILPINSITQSQQSKSISKAKPLAVIRISSVHSSDTPKNPIVSDKSTKKSESAPLTAKKSATAAINSPSRNAVPGKWTIDSWKSKKGLQLSEYPDEDELDSVLMTLNDILMNSWIIKKHFI